MFNVKDELQNLSLDELKLEYIKNCNAAKLCCLNVSKDLNLGMMIRTASLFNMSEVILLGKKVYDKRSTVGMHNYIPISRITATIRDHNEDLDIPKIINILTNWSNDYNIIFVEQGGSDIRSMYNNIHTGKPPIFIMGSEDKGIDKEILKLKNTHIVSIPQLGVGRSFNVSNACSIVLWEYYRNLI